MRHTPPSERPQLSRPPRTSDTCWHSFRSTSAVAIQEVARGPGSAYAGTDEARATESSTAVDRHDIHCYPSCTTHGVCDLCGGARCCTATPS